MAGGPPSGPSSAPRPEEQVNENVTEIRKQLQALKTEIDAEADKEQYLNKAIDTMLPKVVQLRKDKEDIKAADTEFAKNPQYMQLEELEKELVTEVTGNADIDREDLIAGLLDKADIYELDPTTRKYKLKGNIEELLQATEVEDEIKALRATMKLTDKIEEGVSGLYNKLPEPVRKMLDSVGIGAKEAIVMIMGFVADQADGIPFLRGFSMSMREGMGVRKAKAEGVTDEAVITEGVKNWKVKYNEWMAVPENPAPYPDPYTFIMEANTNAEKNQADEELRKKNEEMKAEFETYVATSPNFWPGATVEVGSDALHVVRDGGGWKVQLPITGFEKDGTTFKRSAAAEKVFKVYDSIKGIASVSQIDGAQNAAELSVASDGSHLIVKAAIEGDVTDNRLTNILRLNPSGKFNTVKLLDAADGAYKSSTAFAKLENSVLSVNLAALDDATQLNSLRDAANATTAAVVNLEFKSGKWNEIAPA